jgi:hypothetical protein
VLAAVLLAMQNGPVRGQLEVGLNVGPTLTNISGSFIESSSTTSGIYIGAMLEYQFHARWAVETGFTSLQKGAFNVTAAGSDGEWDYRTSYVQIPVRLRYLIPFAGDNWIFGPFVGAGFSFNGSCKVRQTGFPIFDDDCSSATPGGSMEKTDFMYSFGVVLDRVFGQSAFGFDARYSHGTKDIFVDAAAEGLTAKNRTFDIKFRMVFPSFGSW